MTVAGLILAALLGALAVLFVARPFLRSGDPEEAADGSTQAGIRRVELIEERDRALSALKELEFDHRTGKIGDDDYRELVGPLRQEAADAIRALDPPPVTPPGPHALEPAEEPVSRVERDP